MKHTFRIFQGTQCIADGVTARVEDGVLGAGEHALDVFARANAAQVAVQDLSTKSLTVPLRISRAFSSPVRAIDAGLRTAQARTGQHDLIIELDDDTDTHQWTLSDQDGNGAAWKTVSPERVVGERMVADYEVTGGILAYTGPLAETFDDTIDGVSANSALCTLLNGVLARVTLGSSDKLELVGQQFAGTLSYAGTSLDGVLKVRTNDALTGFSAPALTSLAGTLNLYHASALTTFSAPALASLTGTLDLGLCATLTTVELPASVAIGNGFYAAFNGCALDAAAVDAILSAFAAGMGGTVAGLLNLGGSNAAPTGGSSNADYLALTGAGITVSIT